MGKIENRGLFSLTKYQKTRIKAGALGDEKKTVRGDDGHRS